MRHQNQKTSVPNKRWKAAQLLRSKFKKRGVLTVLLALLLPVMMTVAGFVADMGNLIVVRTTLGAAADAGALAAAGNLMSDMSYSDIQQIGADYAQVNVPTNYGSVSEPASVVFGVWDPQSRTFTPANSDMNAVKVTTERSNARGNPVPSFFGKVVGVQSTDLTASAVAVGAVAASNNSEGSQAVYVTSTKDLSNVVLEFEDGSHQKFEGLSSYTGTFQGEGEHAGKSIVGVWIKSGCNMSGDGPGYGEYVEYPGDDSTVHGDNQARGCTPHVTASFQATGVEFYSSGAPSPVRLVQ